jgi:xanthosine utilization system XapX-like protein
MKTLLFIAGLVVGITASVYLDNRNPIPPLFAFACGGLGMPAAMTMDDELVCLRPDAIVGQAESMNTIIVALQEGLDRNSVHVIRNR